MNVIKLHPDQDGSVWYLPEGLPGVLAIRNNHTIVFLIKKIDGTNRIPTCYYLKSKNLCFAGEPLFGGWGYNTTDDYPANFYMPSGYRFNFMIDYRLFLIKCIDGYIKEEFGHLYTVYCSNQTITKRIKEWINKILYKF